MKQIVLIYFLFLTLCEVGIENLYAQQKREKTDETIFIWGGDINTKFVQYIADLTKKENPKVCYLPTASGDHPDNIKYWENICNRLELDTLILRVWVSTSEKNKSFEEIILNADAIVAGGGNTLNMLGIWKAQGIDTLLAKALKKGIILSGGSAGSICWFQNGISDSRPVSLSVVDGLGFLPFSNCPHYSQEARKKLYCQMILEQQIHSGYATDENAGILFKNGKAVEFVSQGDKHNSYLVSLKKGIVESKKIESKILVNKNAISENDYSSSSIHKTVKDLLKLEGKTIPLNAFITITKELRLNKENLSEIDKDKILSITIEKIFLYEDKLAGVVNDAYDDFYGLWYFYNNNGIWESIGEDIGGETVFESEITFREKAKIMIESAQK